MNPLRARRLSLGLTQDALARTARLSRQLILRAEQGTYTNIPPRLLHALYPTTVERLVAKDLYQEFQTSLRVNAYGQLDPSFDFTDVSPKRHPFIEWRISSGLNTIQFCKLFAVQHSIVHRWEDAPPGRNGGPVSVPGPVVTALQDAGYPPHVVAGLQQAYAKYRGR